MSFLIIKMNIQKKSPRSGKVLYSSPVISSFFSAKYERWKYIENKRLIEIMVVWIRAKFIGGFVS